MRRILPLVALFALIAAPAALAQAPPGSLSGIVTGPTGAPVVDAPVQAKSQQGGMIARAATDTAGRYTLPSLPADAR